MMCLDLLSGNLVSKYSSDFSEIERILKDFLVNNKLF